MKKIAVFASGSGSNAESILSHFEKHSSIKVSILLSNKSNAFALERAKKFNVATHVFNRQEFYETSNVAHVLKEHEIDWVVLAGFLWLIPSYLVNLFPGKIINIHPALLPKYGGKGMYGMNVHKAVVEAGEKESGMTIHFVNDRYDEGNIIFQDKCEIRVDDTPEDVAKKVLALEHEHFASVIQETIINST